MSQEGQSKAFRAPGAGRGAPTGGLGARLGRSVALLGESWALLGRCGPLLERSGSLLEPAESLKSAGRGGRSAGKSRQVARDGRSRGPIEPPSGAKTPEMASREGPWSCQVERCWSETRFEPISVLTYEKPMFG